MINFYGENEKKKNEIQKMSEKLNKYKSEKNYSLIESSIKEYIAIYAINIMENEKNNETHHSSILMTNIKRWKKISNKFHFENSENNEYINILFEAYICLKKKNDSKLYELLEMFKNIKKLITDDCINLCILSLKLGQCKVIDLIIKIIGDEKVFEELNKLYPELTDEKDYYTSGKKLYKRYKKLYS
jgi:hypothetical protein